jgi:hypothetical protein
MYALVDTCVFDMPHIFPSPPRKVIPQIMDPTQVVKVKAVLVRRRQYYVVKEAPNAIKFISALGLFLLWDQPCVQAHIAPVL